MFKVALVVPKTSLKLASDCSPPLGLAYLAGYLRAKIKGIDVKIFDSVAGADVWTELSNFQPNLVGITATTPQINAAYELADSLRMNCPGITIVLGGPHVSVLPEEALQHCNFVVIGEGETAFADIVKEVITHRLPRISPLVHGQPVECLDDLPLPAYDLLNIYFYLSRHFLEPLMYPVLGLVTSRGCPYRCAFCYNSGRQSKVRYLSAERIADELTFLHGEYGVCNFFFQDDEFLINRQRLNDLAVLFKQRGIDKWVKWGCQARVTSLNQDVLGLVASIGCVLIVPGMESHNPRILNYLKAGSVKQTDLDKAVRLFVCSEIKLYGNFVVGVPSESTAEMWESIRFFVNSPSLANIMLNILTPYPGTKVWTDCQTQGLLTSKLDYSRLIPTQEGDFNVSTLPEQDFKSFLVDAGRVVWFVKTLRLNPSLQRFFGLAKAKTWWWMWLAHPKFMVTLLNQAIRSELIED